MIYRGLSLAQLMRESGDFIEFASHQGSAQEQLIADRILGDAQTWQRWEIEHAGLLRKVAAHRLFRAQDEALRASSFTLIHRKALFEYLRDRGLRGTARQFLVSYFYPTAEYGEALVREHGQYLRSAGSLLCVRHVGSRFFRDETFQEALQRYESRFAEYFDAFCRAALASAGLADAGKDAAAEDLLPQLKYELSRLRHAFETLPVARPAGLQQPARRPRLFLRAAAA